ncbi:anillin/rhotekin rtkn [Anaeramoeba flamelloides]|uniref:Anillin/rhotekin rtkn n=1 Tax=Anaeramoeba flamelloides TaxID=1746091 RepID=A0AAV8A315_9EUKA|nr:anillin/rhotekin rtkn [Anaeramoeba flamelloides]
MNQTLDLDFLPTNHTAFLDLMLEPPTTNSRKNTKRRSTHKKKNIRHKKEKEKEKENENGLELNEIKLDEMGNAINNNNTRNNKSTSNSESSSTEESETIEYSSEESIDIKKCEDLNEIDGDFFLIRDFTNRHNKQFFQTLQKWLEILSIYCVEYQRTLKFPSKKKLIKWVLIRIAVFVMIFYSLVSQLFSLLNATIKPTTRDWLFGVNPIPGFWETSNSTALSSIGYFLFSLIPIICWVFSYSFFRKPHFNNLLKRFFQCPENGPKLAKYTQHSIKFLKIFPTVGTLVMLLNYLQPHLRQEISKQPISFCIDLVLSSVAHWFQFSIVVFSILLIIFVSSLHKIHIKVFHNIFLEGHLSIPNAINYHISIRKGILLTGKIFEKFLAVVTAVYLISTLTTVYIAFSDFESVSTKLIPVCVYLFLILFMLWYPAGISSACMNLIKDLTGIKITNYTTEKGKQLAVWYTYLDNWLNHPYTGFTLFDFPIYQSTVLKLVYIAGSLLVVLLQHEITKIENPFA